MNYKTFKLTEILDSAPTNSKVTRTFCNQHPGNIPVYASSKNENELLGSIKDNLIGIKYYENCLSYNRNGSVGYVFFRNHRFTTNEDHRVLALRPEYADSVDYEYIKYELQGKLLENFSYNDKAGINKILEIELKIPVDTKDRPDLSAQQKLAQQYKHLEKMEFDLIDDFNEFKNYSVQLKINGKIKQFPITEIFTIVKGNSKYTRKYFLQHKGEFPVFSSQTVKDGVIGYINTYDFDTNCLTWTTDGIKAGTLFIRESKFSMTTHCGALLPKQDYNEKIDLKFIFFQLRNILKDYAVGEGNKRLTVEAIEEIVLNLPIDSKGQLDLKKQLDFSKKYELLEQVKDGVKLELSELINTKIVLSKV